MRVLNEAGPSRTQARLPEPHAHLQAGGAEHAGVRSLVATFGSRQSSTEGVLRHIGTANTPSRRLNSVQRHRTFRLLQQNLGNRAVQRLRKTSATALPLQPAGEQRLPRLMEHSDHLSPLGLALAADPAVAVGADLAGTAARNIAPPLPPSRLRNNGPGILPANPLPVLQMPEPAAELSPEATGRPAPDAAPAHNEPSVPAPMASASPLNAKVGDQAQQIQADSARSEAQVAKIANVNRQRVVGLFGGLRSRFSGFFAKSSADVQKFIAGKQKDVSAAGAAILKSAQELVANAANGAETNADGVRKAIDSTVKSAADALVSRVQGIKGQIVGVIGRFPLPNLPGVAQLRSLAANIVQRAAGVVTSGLTEVQQLISSALASGMSLIGSMIGLLRQLADAALVQVGSAVQRIVQVVFQTLSRTATLITTALTRVFNATLSPMLNSAEGKIQQAIAKSQQQAVAAIRTNRDQHLQALSPQAQAKGGGSTASGASSGSDGIAQEARQNNQHIVQIFQERSSALIGSILERVNTAVSRIIDRVTQAVAQVTQLIAGKLQEVVQGFSRIVQAVGSFIQSAVQALTGALSRVVGYVKALIRNPVGQLLRFGEGILGRVVDFIGRLVQNLLSAITDSPPTREMGQFEPGVGYAPAPAFVGPLVPVIVAALTAIIVFFGGSVIVIGGTVMIIIGGAVFFVSETVVIVVAVVLAILLLLLLIYVLYRILRKKRPKPSGKIISQTVQAAPGPRSRTMIGVGEEVNLRFTGGSTTWATTGGKLSALTGASVQLTAPDIGGSITVTAGTDSISFNVAAPAGVHMERRGAMKHTVNQPDSGVRMRPFLLPDTVNFYRVIYHEMDVPFVPTPGVYSCNPFKTGHCGAGGGGKPCPDLSVTNKVVAGQGTQTANDDCAYSGHCGTAPPFAQGSVLGSIPHEYKVGGGSFHKFAPVLQKHSLAADGATLTTEKDHAKGTIKVTAPSSANGC